MNIHAPLSADLAPLPLDGRVALVTGSTRGIGLGLARALAAAGCAVVLNGFGRPEEIVEARLRLMSDFHVEARYSAADMAQPAAIADMIAMTLDAFGRLDVLVNNAAIRHVAPFEQFPPETWDAILAVNLSAAFHTTRLALPAMRANTFGRIINIASAHGPGTAPFRAADVATLGLVGLTRATARETAADNITCNAIYPAQADAPGQPNGRVATVEALGALVVFLASEAAASISGIALPVDGGWAAHQRG